MQLAANSFMQEKISFFRLKVFLYIGFLFGPDFLALVFLIHLFFYAGFYCICYDIYIRYVINIWYLWMCSFKASALWL